MQRLVGNEKLDAEVIPALEEHGYKLVRPLSAINNTFVYLATRDGNNTILKLFSDLFLMDRAALTTQREKLEELTLRELDILERIDHPNLPRLEDRFDIHPFDMKQVPVRVAAIEYIEDPSLLDRMHRGQRLSEEEALRVIKDGGEALHYLNRGLEDPVFHRDIKPGNIMLGPDKATLIDFNFSQVGNGSSQSTMIMTFGYYPLDAMVGHSDEGHDIVALGNAVIAALYGQEIMAIRDQQGRPNIQEPIDINDLRVSERLKSLLRKMTTPEKKWRFKNARSLVEAVESDDPIVVETNHTGHDSQLEELLRRIQEVDPSFEYNVPPRIREVSSDSELLSFLERVYEPELLVITGQDAVSRYARIGDRVRTREELFIKAGSLSQGDELEYLACEGDTLLAKKDNVEYTVRPTDVKVTAHKRIMGRAQLPDAQDFGDDTPKKSTLVYHGEKKVFKKDVTPKGTEGILVWRPQNVNNWAVVWEGKAGRDEPWSRREEYINGRYTGKSIFTPPYALSANELEILQKNPVDIAKLKEEVYGSE